MPSIAPRALAGIALMIVATALGGLLLQRATQRTTVWAFDRALASGTVLRAGDVHLAEVALPEAAPYLPASSSPAGRVLATDAVAGELVSRSALADSRPRPHLVTLPMEPLHAPPQLHRGDRVDVVVTAVHDGQVGASAVLQRNVLVDEVAAPDGSGRSAVVLAVTQRESVALVAALRAGQVDLVAVGERA